VLLVYRKRSISNKYKTHSTQKKRREEKRRELEGKEMKGSETEGNKKDEMRERKRSVVRGLKWTNDNSLRSRRKRGR